jgi:hypothetical protein
VKKALLVGWKKILPMFQMVEEISISMGKLSEISMDDIMAEIKKDKF